MKGNRELDLQCFTKIRWKKVFFSHSHIQATIELDAIFQGLGAVCINQGYAIKIPVHIENYSIVHLEMLNILL